MNSSERKNQLREIFLNQRRELSVEEWKRSSETITNRFMDCLDQIIPDHPKLGSRGMNIHCYLSTEKNREVRTDELIKQLKYQGHVVGSPKTDWNSFTMKTIALLPSTSIKEGNLGIREPEEGEVIPVDQLDMVIVPSVALDKEGGRIGYGKGFYDRYLSILKEGLLEDQKPITIAPAFDFSLSEEPFILEDTDVKIDWIVTEKRLIKTPS